MDHLKTEELRDDEIGRRTNEKYNAMRAAVLAGDKPTIKAVHDMVLDYVAAVPLEAVMTQRLPATERALAELVKRLMLDICEIEAIKEVEGVEADNRSGLCMQSMSRATTDAAVRNALAVIQSIRFPRI